MSLEAILNDARQSIIEQDTDKAVAAAKQALEEKLDPVVVLSEGFSAGIRDVGDMFGRGEMFLPELILSAEVMKEATAVLDEALKTKEAKKLGKMLIATVEGDVHDIGKGIVISLIKTQGVDVVDLGREVPVDKIIEAAEREQVDIIGTSALLTTTMTEQRKLEEELRRLGIREKYKTIIGGAPCTKRWADKIGADDYAEDAADAVKIVLAMLGAK